jgi:hypothetical protein
MSSSSGVRPWVTITVAIVASALSAGSLAVAIVANSISNNSLNLARSNSDKLAAITPIGGILGPTVLDNSFCFRVNGYSSHLPGNASLWLAIQAVDFPRIFFVEVQPADTPNAAEKDQAAERLRGSTPFVAAVQIGDNTKDESDRQQKLTLYWADTQQAEVLRAVVASGNVGSSAIPTDIERQGLGDPLLVTHPRHVRSTLAPCTLTTANKE